MDDDATLATVAANNGYDDISGCIDVPTTACGLNNNIGNLVRQYCCDTCNIDPNAPPPENELPDTDETLQVFLLSGQSECFGQARVGDLVADSSTYPELQGEIDGVYFAGYKLPESTDRYFIAPMKAARDRPNGNFGPEVSFGERIHSITGKNTMIMKYCVGGTSVHTHWNPTTPENSWNKNADDGTSQWMQDNAGLDFTSKNHLFKNMVYTIRKTEETLKEGGVSFNWAGIIWIQGNADSKEGDPVWKVFGENTARVWDGFRDAFNPTYVDGTVPIVDTGSASKNTLKSGKEYATQIVKGCKAINVESGSVADDETSDDCVVSTSEPCLDADNRHTHPDFYNFYGYDPLVPDDLKPDGFVDKTFKWFAKFPTNLHSGHEGMILKGWMLANHFTMEFTDYDLPSEYASFDPAIQFPWIRCDDGTLPSDDYICWIDHREDDMMVELCVEENAEMVDDNSGASTKYSLTVLLFLFSGILFPILS